MFGRTSIFDLVIINYYIILGGYLERHTRLATSFTKICSAPFTGFVWDEQNIYNDVCTSRTIFNAWTDRIWSEGRVFWFLQGFNGFDFEENGNKMCVLLNLNTFDTFSISLSTFDPTCRYGIWFHVTLSPLGGSLQLATIGLGWMVLSFQSSDRIMRVISNEQY